MSADLAGLIRKELLAILAEVVGPLSQPDMRDFRIGIIQVTPRGTEIRYRDAPAGPRVDPARGYAADRALVVEAAARTIARRGARIARGEAARIDDADWVERLRAAHPGWFACEVSCGPGWSDLLHAMAAWLAEHALPAGFGFTQVKEKYGGLRAYHASADARVDGIVEAFEALAEGVCEDCGRPGVMCIAGSGLYHTACTAHARGRPVGEG